MNTSSASIGVPAGAAPERWLGEASTSDGAPSARNLIVTLFGDLLGTTGRVSVRSVGALLESFGVNDRLARTSLSRLVGDGLLAVERRSGRAYYGVSRESVGVFRQADRRIYQAASPDWDGEWTVVVIDPNEGTQAERAQLRSELGWAGFGSVAPGVLVSATVDLAATAEVIARVRDRSGGPGGVLLTRGELGDLPGVLDDGALARRSSSLEMFEERYAGFVAGFSPLLDMPPIDDRLALKLRLLVVAEFRRIVLADPGLPAGLLPPDWSGFEARRVASSLHSAVAVRGEAERDRVVEWAPEADPAPVQLRRFAEPD